MLVTIAETRALTSVTSLSLFSSRNNTSNFVSRHKSCNYASISASLSSSTSSTLTRGSSVFDPLGIENDNSWDIANVWDSVTGFLAQTFESTSGARKDRSSSGRGVAAAIEDSSIDFGDFFKGPLPGKFLQLLGLLALSRLGIYVPLGGVNREAFVGNIDQTSFIGTLDTFSGGGIGRLGICSLGIVPFIIAQIVFQLLAQVYPKLQDLQKREGEAGKKKILQYTRYASVGFALVQREFLSCSRSILRNPSNWKQLLNTLKCILFFYGSLFGSVGF